MALPLTHCLAVREMRRPGSPNRWYLYLCDETQLIGSVTRLSLRWTHAAQLVLSTWWNGRNITWQYVSDITWASFQPERVSVAIRLPPNSSCLLKLMMGIFHPCQTPTLRWVQRKYNETKNPSESKLLLKVILLSNLYSYCLHVKYARLAASN